MGYYADYFTVPENYKANMTREAINETPETWLDFYPHKKYERFLETLLDGFQSNLSAWLFGNYGTGKSNAALVTQKLFMDDPARVRSWFERCASALSDREALEATLFACRDERTLVVYDYNSSGVGPNDDFLVRLEKGVVAALNERKLIIPAKSNITIIIERLEREGEHFFTTRDSIQSELAYLHPGISSTTTLIDLLNAEHKNTDTPTRLLDDVQRVFHKDDIFLSIGVPTFKTWVNAILDENKYARIVYIFDEFSEFIDENRTHLKTFEEVTENPGIDRFFFVPVTHLELTAFVAEGSASAKRSKDRFYTRNLQMPNDTAFKLAKHAIKDNTDPKIAAEWKTEKEKLYGAVSGIADKFNTTDPLKDDYVSRESFYDILPIHPMAAFLLKFLSESARSNQRSIFEYLKGSANGREFQDFIRTAGPGIPSKQFLTVDYLWKYFVERDDLGVNPGITEIRFEYERIRNRDFSNQADDASELRVLKTVLLFCLLKRLSPDGHERLKPTVENVELSFKGDGAIINVGGIIKSLADKHCFSVVNNNISLFTTSVGGAELQEKIAEQENKFDELLSEKVKKMLDEHTKRYRASHSANRFEIRVTDESHTKLNITQPVRDRYSSGNGTVCLWFVIAKNENEQRQIPERIKNVLTQLHDHRILMFTFPLLSFCHNNVKLWYEYVRQIAQYRLENDDTAKKQIRKAYESLENEWFDEIRKHSREIKVYSVKNGEVVVDNTSWGSFEQLISDYVRQTIQHCVDYLAAQITAFNNSGLKSWAFAGIQFEAASGQYRQLVNGFKSQGISADADWFAQNPQHALAEIHALFEKKIANTIGRNTSLSIRKVYIELQRAPFGMRYNALSAFVLGFALRDILPKNYQWTNGQMTKPLDANTLAEIIEDVVKDDGNDRLGIKEKLICKLSKEEKAFVEKAPAMFGVSPMPDETIESVLVQIQNKIESVSMRVPLWVLPEYIHGIGDENAETIEKVLNYICTAFSISSKGKVEERANAVMEVGRILLEDGQIANAVVRYIKSDCFIRAFEIYVDKENTALNRLAEGIGDYTRGYCSVIRDKAIETACWLYKPADISNVINEVFSQYEVISLVKPLFGYTDFIAYKDVMDALRIAIMKTNRLPKRLIESLYPMLSAFLLAIQTSGSANEIKNSIALNQDIIVKLFFDPTKTEAVKIVKSRLSGTTINNNELLAVMNSVSGGFDMDESVFIESLFLKINEDAKQAVVRKIKETWRKLSGTDSPSDWALNNKIPARLIFGDFADADDFVKAIEQPDMFAPAKLADLLERLMEVAASSISDCQRAFLAQAIPSRYAKFDINLASLLEFLRKRYGQQPNNWERKPDISEFIRDQYKNSFAPQITEKIRDKDANALKQKLLELAQVNPDLGLLFWE